MKKFLSFLLVLVLVASVFVGCNPVEQPDGNETEAPKATLEKAVEFLVTTYKSAEGKETSNNYELIPQITIDGVSYTVTWTVDNENITITKDESGFYVVNLPTNNAEKCEYTLTATVTAPDGKTATKTMKRVLPVISKVEGVETDLKAETAYKLFFDQKGVGKVLFLTAETSGNYIKTVVDPKVAADFFAEAAEGGFKVYTLVNGAKNYIKASTVPKDDGKVSKVIGFDAAGSVFKYNKEINAWYTTIDGTNYTMGTYGTYETVSISEDSYYTPENTGVSQFPVQFITKAAGEAMAPSVGPADPTELTSIKDAVAKGLAMEHNTFTVEKYLVKGTVTEIANTQYGNLYIEDAEGNKIYVYGLYNNDGSVRFDAMTTQPKVGDVITVMSVIGQYNDAAQLKNAWLMNIEVPELSDADKVAAEKDALSIDADGVVYLDTVITLPTKGASHDAVTITWAAPADYAGTAVAYDATTGKLTVTIGDAEETYKLTATIKCGEVTDTKEVTLTIAKKAAYTVNVVSAPVANTAYKLYFKQLNAGKVLFVNGEVDGRYLKTTMNVLEAVDVYAEAVEGGYKFYTLVDDAKAYLNAYLNDSGKTSLNFVAESASVYKYNAETFAWEVAIDGTNYYVGSYNAFETVSLSKSDYIKADNTRVTQFPLELVEIVCAHDFDATKCESTCTICGAASEPNHQYDNACDAKCNVCEAEREVEAHVYDNACDANCNVCNETREVADHVYDNACDATCNVCQAERTAADHVYDDDCDAQCNVCQAERVAPHKYSADCDEKCDSCGTTRTVETAHTYENDCDKDCNVCKATRVADCKDENDDGVCDVCNNVIDKAEVEKSHIAYEKEQITFADVKCDAPTVTLPAAGKNYTDVTITWAIGEDAVAGNVNLAAAATEQTITLVATFTCGDTTETAEYKVKVLAHNFAKACSETCGVCGADNEDAADHTWAGCTDTDCDVCGATRTAGEHTFAKDCTSTQCQNCDYNRTASEHVYADDCTSVKCQNENCDVDRVPAEHVWANCDATKCTNCAVTRTAVPHVDVEPKDDKCDECGANLAVEETAFKLYMTHGGKGGKYYFLLATTQENNNKYINTTNDPKEAPDFYKEEVDGGCKIYTIVDGVKTYIKAATVPKVDGSGVSKYLGFDTTGSVFVYSEAYQAWYTTIDGVNYVMGTYGTFETASISDESFYTDSTKRASQYPVTFITKADGEALEQPSEPEQPEQPEQSGDTLSIADAISMGQGMAHDTYTTEKYYVVGEITEIYNTTYGNMKIKDAAGNILTVYGTYSADGSQRFDAMSVKPEVGATIKVYGVIGQYNNTPQMKNAWIIEISGNTHTHTYADATCTAPKTCTCGATEGNALGHNYVDGVCGVCGSSEPSGEFPAIGTGYYLASANSTGDLYFDGTMKSGRINAVADKSSAVQVYLEAASAEGEYYLYFMDGATKTYISVNPSTSSKTAAFVFETQKTTNGVWLVNKDDQTILSKAFSGRGIGTQTTSTYNNFSTYSTSNTTGYDWAWFE